MRYLILIIFTFFLVKGVAQVVYPIPYTPQGSPATMVQIKGGLKSDSTMIPPVYSDTFSANASKTSLYAGSVIRVADAYYYRNTLASGWIPFTSSVFPCQGTHLVSGSVTWSGVNYIFDGTRIVYGIGCNNYVAPPSTQTLPAADPTYPRIDIFYADINSTVGFLTGTPSPNPQPPQLNPLTQISLGFVLVSAGSVSPSGQTVHLIYDENVSPEWAGSSNIAGIDFAATTPTPCYGTVSTKLPNATNGRYVQWQNPFGASDITNGQYLKLRVKLSGTPTVGSTVLTIAFWNAGTKVTQDFTLANGSYGLDYSSTACQSIVIPVVAPFNGSTADRVIFTTSGASGITITLDRIYLLEGANPPPTPSGGGLKWTIGGDFLNGIRPEWLGSLDKSEVGFITEGVEKIVLPADTINISTDTSDFILVIPSSGRPYLKKIHQPSIYALGCLKIYDSTSTGITRKYIRDTCSGGGGSTPNLLQVTAVDSVTTHGMYIDTVNSTRGTAYFFGNSITAGYGLPSTRFRYSTLFSNYYGYTENNLGLSGSYLEKRVPVDPTGVANMVDRIPLIPVPSTGDLLVFMYGINDINFVSANYNPTNYVADYTTVLNAAVAQGWSGSNILLITPTYVSPTSYQSVLGNPAATLARQTSFDSCVQVLATTFGTHFYDSYSYMAANGGRSLFNAADSLHPNIQGHNVIFNGAVAAMGYNVLGTSANRFSVNGQAAFNNIKLNTTRTTNIKYNILATDSTGGVSKLTNQVVVLDTLARLNLGTDTAGRRTYNFYGGNGLFNEGLIVNSAHLSAATQPNIGTQILNSGTNGYIDAFSMSSVSKPLLLNSVAQSVVGVGTANPTTTATMSIVGSGTTSINLGKGYGGIYNGIWMNGLNGTSNYNILSSGSDLNLYLNRPTGYDMIFAENNVLSSTPNMAIKSGGFIGMGIDPSTSAGLLLAAGSTSKAPLRLTSGALATTPVAGNIMFNNGLLFLDSTASKRDTIATRDWARANISGGSGSGVTSVSGTTNRITSTGGATPVIDISSSYVGQNSITTLGTIATGVWNGTAIANANLANSSLTVNGTSIALGASGTVTAAAGTLTGTTLASGVTASSLTSFGASIALGTPASGVGTNLTGIPLTSAVTGVLPIANGGTSQSSYATGDLIYASATNVLSKRTIGAQGEYFTVNASGVPIWQALSLNTFNVGGNSGIFIANMRSATTTVGTGTNAPVASAVFESASTTKGILFPRMTTTQKNAISSPAEGLVVYDLTLHKLCVYTGSAWETVTSL